MPLVIKSILVLFMAKLESCLKAIYQTCSRVAVTFWKKQERLKAFQTGMQYEHNGNGYEKYCFG